MNWLTNFVRPKITSLFGKKDVPDNLWKLCPVCEKMIYQKELTENLYVCNNCNYHFNITPKKRFEQHKKGGKLSNKYVKKYGKYIKQKNIPDKNPHSSRLKVENQEEEVAKILKKRGWAVWWN